MRKFFRVLLRFFREADMFLFAICLISVTYGIILISSVVGESGRSDIYVQTGALFIGTALFVLFSYIDVDIIADKSRLLMIFSVLFILTLYFWGYGEDVGNVSWLRFGSIGVQPAEIVKVPFIIIIAKMISNYKERKTLNTFGALLKILGVFAIIFVAIMFVSRDLGSALVYAFVLVVMLFISGVQLRFFAIGGGVLAAASPLIWLSFLTERQKTRIMAPFDPAFEPDRLDVLWQASQSVKAITAGGFSGQGLGQGRMTQSGTAVPAQRTDFIFSAAGEELGFVGCMLIVLLLTMIIVRCIYIGTKSNSSLSMLVCTGVAAMLILQTVENIGMCLGLLPVIGLTLPFFSYGGSSIVTCFAAMGIVSGIKMRPMPVRYRAYF